MSPFCEDGLYFLTIMTTCTCRGFLCDVILRLPGVHDEDSSSPLLWIGSSPSSSTWGYTPNFCIWASAICCTAIITRPQTHTQGIHTNQASPNHKGKTREHTQTRRWEGKGLFIILTRPLHCADRNGLYLCCNDRTCMDRNNPPACLSANRRFTRTFRDNITVMHSYLRFPLFQYIINRTNSFHH